LKQPFESGFFAVPGSSESFLCGGFNPFGKNKMLVKLDRFISPPKFGVKIPNKSLKPLSQVSYQNKVLDPIS